MASKNYAAIALFLSLNLLFSSLATATTLPTCPIDTLKLGVCADLLGLANIIIGSPPTKPCCSLIENIADLEAAVCLCTAIKAGILGTVVDVQVKLTLLLNVCGKKLPSGFICA